jgi:hypothetical protein
MALLEKLSVILFILISCGQRHEPVLFPVRGTDMVLLGNGREAVNGSAGFTKPKKLEYRFEGADSGAPPPVISPPASMEIEYSFNADGKILDNSVTVEKALWVILEMEGNLWGLPLYEQDVISHYAIPVLYPGNFNITLSGIGIKDNKLSIKIHSIEFKERWFGFSSLREDERAPDGGVPNGVNSGALDSAGRSFTSPFVTMTKRSGESGGSSAWEINPPENYYVPAGFYSVISADLLPGKDAAFDAGEFHLDLFPSLGRLRVPAGLVSPGTRPLTLKGDRVDSFRMSYAKAPIFPEPIPADPGLILSWPVESWRDKRYEIFRWEQFPSLLIFDFADYATQDRMLKRLAFFVEKKGFRGRLAPDSEIAELHGWNAHDYRAEDLARFFQAAREVQFPLLAEERELERILLNAGIINAEGDIAGGVANGSKITAGGGGIISVSRESSANLRALFMAHEGFHGLFFIDGDFRNFTRARWRQLPPQAKRFIVSYFGFQQYDTADEYLLVNEFMGHVLQQSVSQAGYYFGTALPARLETSWRKQDLPPKDEVSNSWPVLAEAFTREAQAFSDYVANRWGLAAGRVSLVKSR